MQAFKAEIKITDKYAKRYDEKCFKYNSLLHPRAIRKLIISEKARANNNNLLEKKKEETIDKPLNTKKLYKILLLIFLTKETKRREVKTMRVSFIKKNLNKLLSL